MGVCNYAISLLLAAAVCAPLVAQAEPEYVAQIKYDFSNYTPKVIPTNGNGMKISVYRVNISGGEEYAYTGRPEFMKEGEKRITKKTWGKMYFQPFSPVNDPAEKATYKRLQEQLAVAIEKFLVAKGFEVVKTITPENNCVVEMDIELTELMGYPLYPQMVKHTAGEGYQNVGKVSISPKITLRWGKLYSTGNSGEELKVEEVYTNVISFKDRKIAYNADVKPPLKSGAVASTLSFMSKLTGVENAGGGKYYTAAELMAYNPFVASVNEAMEGVVKYSLDDFGKMDQDQVNDLCRAYKR